MVRCHRHIGTGDANQFVRTCNCPIGNPKPVIAGYTLAIALLPSRDSFGGAYLDLRNRIVGSSPKPSRRDR